MLTAIALCYCNSERSSTRCQTPPKAVDVQYSTVKLPFWFIDTDLLTSCCVTDKCDAPSGASVEQMRLVSLGEHLSTACWLETSDFTVTDKQQPVNPDQSPADTPQRARLTWNNALTCGNVSHLTACPPPARAPPSWAHAAPVAPAAPCKPCIPGGKTAKVLPKNLFIKTHLLFNQFVEKKYTHMHTNASSKIQSNAKILGEKCKIPN